MQHNSSQIVAAATAHDSIAVKFEVGRLWYTMYMINNEVL